MDTLEELVNRESWDEKSVNQNMQMTDTVMIIAIKDEFKSIFPQMTFHLWFSNSHDNALCEINSVLLKCNMIKDHTQTYEQVAIEL